MTIDWAHPFDKENISANVSFKIKVNGFFFKKACINLRLLPPLYNEKSMSYSISREQCKQYAEYIQRIEERICNEGNYTINSDEIYFIRSWVVIEELFLAHGGYHVSDVNWRDILICEE